MLYWYPRRIGRPSRRLFFFCPCPACASPSEKGWIRLWTSVARILVGELATRIYETGAERRKEAGFERAEIQSPGTTGHARRRSFPKAAVFREARGRSLGRLFAADQHSTPVGVPGA